MVLTGNADLYIFGMLEVIFVYSVEPGLQASSAAL